MTQAAVNNAKVLYQLSLDRTAVEKAEQLYAASPVLDKILRNPVIKLKDKNTIIEQIFTLEGLPVKLIRFFQVMCQFGNADELSDILDAYYLYWDQMNHILRAELICAGEPTSEEITAARNLLENRYPGFTIMLTHKSDSSLLGGYLIRTLHKEYDKSFEGYLRQLETKITGR